jgi:glutamate synthase (NADPH/NADH) small chain
MGKPTGFIEIHRKKHPTRPVAERLKDWREVYLPYPPGELEAQGGRCMDCGIPFCHQGCPLGNLIPDWNDLVYRDRWQGAIERLHATNNFPEFTGKLCPAPCEGSCVLGINEDPVTIKSVEASIIDRAWDEGWVTPRPPTTRTWKKIAVVGSGPAGLAAADQLNRAGHSVTVFEKSDRIGGLLRYGIPEFKMEKRFLESPPRGDGSRRGRLQAGYQRRCRRSGRSSPRRLRCGCSRRWRRSASRSSGARTRAHGYPLRDGVPDVAEPPLRRRCDCRPGVHHRGRQARRHHRRRRHGRRLPGYGARQGARAVYQLELLPMPPVERAADNPWPQWPQIFRVSSAHEEGGERVYSVSTQRFSGTADGRVHTLHATKVEMVKRDGRVQFVPVDGSEFEIRADLVLLAWGSSVRRRTPCCVIPRRDLDRPRQRRARQVVDDQCAGRVHRRRYAARSSLIVWAIAEGRSAARAIDDYLMGESQLPAPLA